MTSYVYEHAPRFEQFLVHRQLQDCPIALSWLNLSGDLAPDDAPNFVDLRPDEKGARLSYTTAARMTARGVVYERHPDGALWQPLAHRVITKPGRLAQTATGITDPAKLEAFTHACAAWIRSLSPADDDDDDGEIVTIVTGDEITHRYKERNHCSCGNLGTLENSCMRYNDYDNLTQFYARNRNIALATILCPECDGTRARALLWTDQNGERWLDRRYGNDLDRASLAQWRDCANMHDLYGTGGTCAVDLDWTDWSELPWFDSMERPCRECATIGSHGCPCPGPTCPHCEEELDNDGDACPDARWCPGCRVYRCPADGDHDCYECACGFWYADGETCETCIACGDCGELNTPYNIAYNHGRCSECAARMDEETPIPRTETRYVSYTYGGSILVMNCPVCDSRHETRGTRLAIIRHIGEGDFPPHEHCQTCAAPVIVAYPDLRPVVAGPVTTLPRESLREHIARRHAETTTPARPWSERDALGGPRRFNVAAREIRWYHTEPWYCERSNPFPIELPAPDLAAVIRALVVQDDVYAPLCVVTTSYSRCGDPNCTLAGCRRESTEYTTLAEWQRFAAASVLYTLTSGPSSPIVRITEAVANGVETE